MSFCSCLTYQQVLFLLINTVACWSKSFNNLSFLVSQEFGYREFLRGKIKHFWKSPKTVIMRSRRDIMKSVDGFFANPNVHNWQWCPMSKVFIWKRKISVCSRARRLPWLRRIMRTLPGLLLLLSGDRKILVLSGGTRNLEIFQSNIHWSDSPFFYEVKKYPKEISPQNNNLPQSQQIYPKTCFIFFFFSSVTSYWPSRRVHWAKDSQKSW